MAGVFFWNAMKTPKKIFTTWNPIAGTSQIRDGEDERFGNNSVAISLLCKGSWGFKKRRILAWI